MTIKDKILQELEKCDGLSDRELTDRILGQGQPQQSINQACRKLESLGKLTRSLSPIKNYLKGSSLINNTLALKAKNDYAQVFKRDEYLEEEFNKFWNVFWETDNEDYYSKFSLEELNELKLALRNVNNLITLKTTILVNTKICQILKIEEDQKNKIENDINRTSSNTNGFDIEAILIDDKSFICEIKANIPAGGKSIFGAAQREQLEKDVFGLLSGKSKSNLRVKDIDKCSKFLGMYCADEKTSSAIDKFVSQTENVELWNNQDYLEKNKVYILKIK